MFKKMTLPQLHITGFALVLVLFLLLWGFGVRAYTNKQADLEKDTKAKQDNGGTAEKVQAKTKELEKEKKNSKQAEADWKVYSGKYMPDLNFSEKTDLITLYQTGLVKVDGATYGLKDMPTVWGRWVESWYDAQRDKSVTRNVPTFAIGSYATDPNTISTLKSITFPDGGKPWAVSVTAKDFDSAMAHLRRFNSMEHHGVPVVSGVAISGHSPNLLLNYNLALYVIPGAEPPKQDPRIGGAAKSGGAGGGMSGMMPGMGGMSGGPSGMSGGPSGASGSGGGAGGSGGGSKAGAAE